MKNVVVYTWAGTRRAVELRWVREIITPGVISAVPAAPPDVVGVTVFHGAVLPILATHAKAGGGGSAPAQGSMRAGDPAIVVEVGDTLVALATEGIGEVATLELEGDTLVDGAGRRLELLAPPDLVDTALSSIVRAGRFAGEP